MNLTARIEWAACLGEHLQSAHPDWLEAKEKANRFNPWFTPDFIERAIQNVIHQYLDPHKLKAWSQTASVPDERTSPAQVGLVMAGNIPLVGFHDWLSVFISGHRALLKLSSQDTALFEYIRTLLVRWDPALAPYIQLADRLNGMDAYIATGSDNSSRYFEYYFGKFPHIIRKNRTSVALLTGQETRQELERLSDDLYLYFGRGCRNVTHLWVPREYDFDQLLEAGSPYQHLSDHHKYKNNLDYQLSLCILNKTYYMTRGLALFVENESTFAPLGVVHFSYYDSLTDVESELLRNEDKIQCRIGSGGLPFGSAQIPSLSDYADGINTLDFLESIGGSCS